MSDAWTRNAWWLLWLGLAVGAYELAANVEPAGFPARVGVLTGFLLLVTLAGKAYARWEGRDV